ncbi:Tfp pilus assembly protein FimT/FimU [Shewanella sp. NIFS-20-20]|uniref:pilus assembly FimT family protein n=1 Tax=Shewanella sp. NIFS-20-20 TaxID=2853806 RepID=UPI001C43E354|nr:type II secretion system protein [Shewanella sp. NIFS-20-20]MBV7317387.1 type II secretion system GspH family protein [Shewanella sp. NIFS-20-20]
MLRETPQLIKTQGFTLIELVVTIMLISILSVTVLPRLLSTDSVSAYTVRDELVAELRKVQLMALNNSDRCYRVAISPLGYQVLHYSDACGGTLARSESVQAFERDTIVTFNATGSRHVDLDFNNLGQVSPSCAGPCLTITASDIVGISIESQGYIHDSE